MRLLEWKSSGNFSLTKDLIHNFPPYAILSHTWGVDTEEVTFEDLTDGSGKSKAGYDKIRFCGEQARRDGLQHFWVDTCCIDKSNSVELQEAINSMFRWYQNAAKCYVYLSDISVRDDNEAVPHETWELAFRESRWFTRGWALQELIAPPSVEFFSIEGRRLGNKKSLQRQISEITGIAIQALQGGSLSQFTVTERMSWAAHRNTTREEDMAYSLLGIFEIYMPLIYGEGREHAFYRLREEINKRPKNSQLDKMMLREGKACSGTQPSGSTVVDSEFPELGNDTTGQTVNGKRPIGVIRASKETFEACSESLTSWLQPASVAEDLRELLDQRHAGTCHWIFDTAEFKDWQAGLFPDLWLYGKPGSGKSVLAATLVEHLRLEETVTAYFFCRLGNDTQRTLESIMRTWLWQILEQMPQFTDLALQHRTKGAGIRSQLEPVKDALRDIIAQSPKIVCLVLDGLDECESGPASAEKVMAFVSALGEKILFAVISRPENWIRKAIYPRMQGKCCTIPVTNEATQEDLECWIQACVIGMQLSDPVLEQSAITKLRKGADGMFLWARFQLEALGAQFAVEDAKAVLQNELPKDLEATYERLLTNIQKSPNTLRRARAFRILQWITAANRPLALTELDFALGIQIDSDVSPRQRSLMRGELDVVDACGSFIEITKTGQIRFVHASAKDFLWSKGVQFGLGQSHSENAFQKALDAMHITRACITCLSFSDIDLIGKRPSTISPVEQLASIVEKHPFLEYAAMNWWKHLNAIPYTNEDLLQNTIRRFLGSSKNTLRWMHLYQYVLQFHSEESALSDPTATSCWKYISCFWNTHLGPNSSNLFNRWQRWHVELWFGRMVLWPPLHIAAFFNFADIVEEELQHGIPVDLPNDLKFTALLQAAHGDSPEALQVLINHGAYVHAQTQYGYTAMRYACRNSLTVLPLLVEAGCQVDYFDWHWGRTALHEAASSVLWHPQVLRTLLNLPHISHIINATDGNGDTPLDCAAAIDLHLLASHTSHRLFHSLGGTQIPVGTGVNGISTIMPIGDFFSARGTTALSALCQGWRDAGVCTPINSTYESILHAFTVWKAKVIQSLLEKGARLAKELEDVVI